MSLSGGKFVTAGVSCAISTKDRPAHLTVDGYIPKLRSIDQKLVVLWDEADKRGYLVNGTSALLHLVRIALHHHSKDKFAKAFRWKPSMMNESASVIDVLIDEENRSLVINTDKPTVSAETDVQGGSLTTKVKWDAYTFQDLVEQHYHYLDQIIDYQSQVESKDGIDIKVPKLRARLEGLAGAPSLAFQPSVNSFFRSCSLSASRCRRSWMSCESSLILSLSSATSSWPVTCWITLTFAVGFWIRPDRRVLGASPRTRIDGPSPGEAAIFLGLSCVLAEIKFVIVMGRSPRWC